MLDSHGSLRTAGGANFRFNKTLHANADAIDATFSQHSQSRFIRGLRRGLAGGRNLSGLAIEYVLRDIEQTLQLRRFKKRWCAATNHQTRKTNAFTECAPYLNCLPSQRFEVSGNHVFVWISRSKEIAKSTTHLTERYVQI